MRQSKDYEDIPRPVVALYDEYPSGYVDPPHCHRRAQLLYACAGVMSVVTDESSFVVPPQRAVWIPEQMMHEVSCRSAVSLRTLYVDTQASKQLPTMCRVIEVSDLLRALILKAMTFPHEYEVDGKESRIMTVILDEIESMPIVPLLVPMPKDSRLLNICHQLINNPTLKGDINSCAENAFMSRRTFTRLFRKETGMSFAAWRQHVCLLEALSRLAIGESVTTVAHEVGYSSSSAFTAMFHRTFGTVPSQYFSHIQES